MSQPVWNTERVLALLGRSRRNIIHEVEKAGYPPPTYRQIMMWERRGTIPEQWLATILSVSGIRDVQPLIDEPEIDPFR